MPSVLIRICFLLICWISFLCEVSVGSLQGVCTLSHACSCRLPAAYLFGTVCTGASLVAEMQASGGFAFARTWHLEEQTAWTPCKVGRLWSS